MKHVISLGAGVQSSTMALMAAHGEITPMPVAAIFADTQAEPKAVYEWLDWLETKLPFPVHRVSKGDLEAVALTLRSRASGAPGQYTQSLIPAYTLNPDGSRGHMQRACTYDYKLMEIRKAQRRICGVKRGEKSPVVTAWIGISLDEAHRMKPSSDPWSVNRWPLIEKRFTRQSCLKWMSDNGYPKPPRSACYFCPYHSNHEWKRLRDSEPEEFARAVRFEKKLQEAKAKTDNMRSIPFLHGSCTPLGEIDFDSLTDDKQVSLFGNECEGICGV